MEKLDIKFIDLLMELYNEFDEKGISFVYLGKFNHKIIKMFTALSGDETVLNKEARVVKRKLHHAVVEILQNMIKHSSQLFNDVEFGRGVFILGKKDKAYYIITINKISIDDITSLSHTIERVNSAGRLELKKMYQRQLVDGVLSQRGGAGLGLIDIARKTGNNLEYHFLPLSLTKKYFVMKVRIDAKSM